MPESVSRCFTDPISGRHLVLRFGERAAGVEHPGCAHLADVSPELDAFFCSACHWNGRISGAWFMDQMAAHRDGSPDA
jgi:hypothetical protein